MDSCFGLVSPHQQSIPQLLSLASRVYKGYQECSTCGSELMRFIPTPLVCAKSNTFMYIGHLVYVCMQRCTKLHDTIPMSLSHIKLYL